MNKNLITLTVFLLLLTSFVCAQELKNKKKIVDEKKTPTQVEGVTATGDKMTVKDEDSNILMEVTDEGDAGSIYLKPLSSIGSYTDKLYNSGGSLFWGNTQLGANTSGGWTDAGNNIYTTTLTDKVGIGTILPSSNLEIAEDKNGFVGIWISNTNSSEYSQEGIIFKNEEGTRAGLVLYDDNSVYSNQMAIYNNRQGGIITFSTAGLERMRLTNNGHLGIKTSSPQASLHIKQTVGLKAIRFEYNTSTSYWETEIDYADDYSFSFNGINKAYIDDLDGAYYSYSDRRLKSNIVNMPSILSKVIQLEPSNYRMKDADINSSLSTGFIAQEVQKLFPETVNEKNGFLSINYDAFAVIAIKAIKEQQQLLEDLTKRLEVLENK